MLFILPCQTLQWPWAESHVSPSMISTGAWFGLTEFPYRHQSEPLDKSGHCLKRISLAYSENLSTIIINVTRISVQCNLHSETGTAFRTNYGDYAFDS